MKIPPFQQAHVRAAVKQIEREGVPKRRRSTKFCLLVGSRHYPPKYVLALAVRNATGKPLLPTDHSGGAETNDRLLALGLHVVACDCGGFTP
jgi:5-methylcytosine-specific restriction protein B